MKKWFKDLGKAFAAVDTSISAPAVGFLILILAGVMVFEPIRFFVLFLSVIVLIATATFLVAGGVFVLLTTIEHTIKNFIKIRKEP